MKTIEGSGAISNADPCSEDESLASPEGEGRLDDDWRHRVRPWILDESPYLARQLSVF